MRKNVSGQKCGAQMVSATDGSAFTGSVTVSVTGDAGTQATGSVGSGACTHEGNGYHTYAPAQAETNYDLIAFTFTGTGAVPTTVQIYTRPTTGLLAPATADRTLVVDAAGLADANAVKVGPSGSGTAQTARDLGASVLISSGTGTGQLSVSSGVIQADVAKINAVSTSSVTTVSANVGTTQPLNFHGTATNAYVKSDCMEVADTAQTAADVGASVGVIIAYIDTEVAAIKAKTDQLTFTVANELNANVRYFGGTAGTFASGRPEVNTTHVGGTSQTARDLGASVLVSSGTGTGQISLSSGTVTVGTNNDKTGYRLSATGVDDVWDEVQSGHTTSGTFGKYVDAAISGVSTGGVSAADIADAVWDEARSGHTTSGTFGQGVASVQGNLTGTVSTLTTYTGNTPQTGDSYAIVNSGTHGNAALKTLIDTVDNFIDTEVSAIKDKTDQLTFTTPFQVDSSASVTISPSDLDAIAEQVIDELGGILPAVDPDGAVRARVIPNQHRG